MHRSGTSAVTRLLGLRGAALPREPIPTAPDNEQGFWEPADIVAIHDEILESAGSAWADVADFPSAWFKSDIANKFKRRLIAAVEKEYGDAPLFIVKDPRLCRLVPLWLDLLAEMGVTPLFVLPVRNPLEVAASLKKRDSFQTETSLLLWLRYFLAAERASRGFQRSFVNYEGLLDNWRSAVDQIGLDLAVFWPRQSYAADDQIDKFLSAEHRHHSFSRHAVFAREHIAIWIRDVFAWAVRAADHAAADHIPANTIDLDAIHAELEKADRLFLPIVSHRDALISVQAAEVKGFIEAAARQTDQYRQLDEQYHQLEEQHRQLDEQYRQLHDQYTRLSDDYRDAKIEVDVLASQIRVLQAEAQREHEAKLETASQMTKLEQELNDRVVEVQALAQLRGELSNVHQSYAALRLQHDMFLNSTTWRMTAPVRSVAGAIPAPVRLLARRAAKFVYRGRQEPPKDRVYP